ncbi:uncharacterized protein LTR77_010758 [Saxophila tyrrhenica]|uniref:Uncharacterized protein n=1 Tax=Saxophila tyrrhenica TaxID=1690608 RepID=A0AAV9NUW0_9PEZI|nr:hypothetical protein LTR77_010758 [Saxophila tyrrhenica]
MSSSKSSPRWEQTELETPMNAPFQTPPAYSEATERQQGPPAYAQSSSSDSSKSAKTSNGFKSALRSFVKGDVFQYHPALVQERYAGIEARVRAEAAQRRRE